MKNKNKSTIEFRYNGKAYAETGLPPVKVKMTMPAEITHSELAKEFNRFLKSIGYVFDGEYVLDSNVYE